MHGREKKFALLAKDRALHGESSIDAGCRNTASQTRAGSSASVPMIGKS
jgi:hypothetical protein